VIDLEKLTGSKANEGESWAYFPPAEYEALPLEHKDQLFYLDKESTDKVYKIADTYNVNCGDDGWGNKPFSGGCYKNVERIERWASEEALKKWMYKCGVPFKSKVLLLPVFSSEDTPVLLTTWKMAVKYAETFFSYDNLIILDPKLKWCLYYHHDDIIHFAEGRHF
jgi:hypothetical protein